jgi:glutathione S-transferase
MASIKVYGVPPSTFTRAVLMGCHEKGVDYELVPTYPGTIGALNPFGKIPAMTRPSFAATVTPPEMKRRLAN